MRSSGFASRRQVLPSRRTNSRHVYERRNAATLDRPRRTFGGRHETTDPNRIVTQHTEAAACFAQLARALPVIAQIQAARVVAIILRQFVTFQVNATWPHWLARSTRTRCTRAKRRAASRQTIVDRQILARPVNVTTCDRFIFGATTIRSGSALLIHCTSPLNPCRCQRRTNAARRNSEPIPDDSTEWAVAMS